MITQHPHLICNGHLGNPLEQVVDKVIKPIFSDCQYQEKCRVRQFGHINCLTDGTRKTCMTYKFYERYGNTELWIGSKL